MVEAVVITRSLHIFFAILWAGATLHYKAVSKPLMQGQGIHAQFLANSKHGPFMGMSALGTVIFGLITYMLVGPANYGSAQSAILGIGMLGGVIALLVGFGGHLPLSIKLKGALAAGSDTEPLIKREEVLDRISGISIMLALLTMITFRWF